MKVTQLTTRAARGDAYALNSNEPKTKYDTALF